MANFNPRQPVQNPGWFEHPEEQIKFLTSIQGILKKIFGGLHDFIFFDKESEFCMKVLKETYGFKDVDALFPRIVNEDKVMSLMEVIMRYAKMEGQWTPIDK